MGVAGQSPAMRKRLLEFVAGMTCDGVQVSSVYGCIFNGTLCSDNGVCTNNACLCRFRLRGHLLPDAIPTASSSATLAAILGSVIPAVVIACWCWPAWSWVSCCGLG